MHLANGTLANEVCIVTAALSAAAVVYAGQRAHTNVTPSLIAKAAIGSALVLAAQAVDVPLFGAVKVHMIGAAFLTLLAGPALALLGMTSVIVFQALALNDGGITALGANVLNMAVVGVAIATVAIHIVRNRIAGTNGLLVGALFASAGSALAAVLAMTVELSLSGTSLRSAFNLTMPAHAPFIAWETWCSLALVAVGLHVRAIKPLAAAPSSK